MSEPNFTTPKPLQAKDLRQPPVRLLLWHHLQSSFPFASSLGSTSFQRQGTTSILSLSGISLMVFDKRLKVS